MVRFKDHTSRDMIPKSAVDDFWQNRVPQWMKVNSQGLYNLQATVVDWTTTDNTEKYYSFDKQGIVPEGQKMAWPILDALDARADWYVCLICICRPFRCILRMIMISYSYVLLTKLRLDPNLISYSLLWNEILSCVVAGIGVNMIRMVMDGSIRWC